MGKTMTGAQAMVEALKHEGVEIIFGIPGGVVLPIFDALYKADIRVMLTRHEQGAIHAADGFARVSGKAGVCIATSGPGATNLVTGLANAHMDSVPLVAFTGQVNTTMIGRDSFQEADITGITIPITKHNYLVKDPADLCDVIHEAFHIATTGRPGPVLIDLPQDVATADVSFKIPGEVDLEGYKPTVKGHIKQIKNAVKIIKQSQRPLFYVGGGVIISGASAELLKLAERMKVPVTHTLMGKGAFPETHELSLGMLGMHGTWAANTTISNADVIIAVGARFDDRVTGRLEKFARNAVIIHADVDPAEIGKNVPIHVPIVGDAKDILQSLLKELPDDFEVRTEWVEKVAKWKSDHPMSYPDREDEIMPQYVVERIYELTQGKAIVCTEVGQNQMWAAQFYKTDTPRTWLSSGGLGTMGYGLPASIGAQIAAPGALVIDIAGDGSFMMNIQELATIAAEGLPIKAIVLNNGYLGMVRQWQEMFYDKRYSSSDIVKNPDLAALAVAFGCVGISVKKKEDLESALKEAFSNGKPTIVDVAVSREANVFPMVPKGASLDEMIVE